MKKRVIIVDRDGTIIEEPPGDFQVDSLEKLRFVPGAISTLASLAGLGYELVMATNQDGLGTDSFPEKDFWPAHERMLETLKGEGVAFDDQLIDRSFESENLPTRKPRTGMFGRYLGSDYDLAASYVIGDRLTDIELAKNLGARGILLADPEGGSERLTNAGLEECCILVTNEWHEAAELIRLGDRTAKACRRTSETNIELELDLDGRGGWSVETGLGFLDHMLMQIVHHAGIALRLKVDGDLHVDEHHTVEDTAIVLGEAVRLALGDKRGIERYGFVLPMDECRAMVLLDFGGRPEFMWDTDFRRERIGDVPTEMFAHFFKSFAFEARCNLHISATGDNEHHKIEGIFKAFARALRAAVKRDRFAYTLPSSKGVL